MAAKKHTITITLSATGSLQYDLDVDGAPSGNGKVTHVKKDDKVEWTCNVGNFAGLFKGETPLDDPVFSGAKGDETGTKPVKKDHDAVDDKKNHYPYFIAIVTADGTVISQDPEIIIDAT
jgi:hypothetical protein